MEIVTPKKFKFYDGMTYFRDIALKLLREKFPEQAESLDENMKNLTEAYKVIFGQLITKYHLLYIMLLKDKRERTINKGDTVEQYYIHTKTG